MGKLSLDLKPDTERSLKQILSLYPDIDVFFRNVIQFQVQQLQSEIINFQLDLDDFEKQYNIRTSVFYDKYKNGEMGDSEDILLWAGIYEMLLENRNKLADIQC